MAQSPTTVADQAPVHGAPPSPPQKSFSLRPAFLVFGLGLVMALIFGILNVTPDPGTKTIDASTASHAVAGSTLRWVEASRALSPIIQAGEPPANIINAVTIPEGAKAVGVIDTSAGASQYDESMRFALSTSQAQLIGFFRTEMKRQGWSITNVGPADGSPGSIEVLGKLAGDDGWYWEQGVVIAPTTFPGSSGSSASATSGASLLPSGGGDTTNFVLRLYQVDDETT